MKAKIVKTGEIVDVILSHKSMVGSNVYYRQLERPILHNKDDLIFIDDIESNINWEQRRYELAKAALNGMLAHSRNGHGYQPRDPQMNWHDAIAEEAIEIADAVIEKLKKL